MPTSGRIVAARRNRLLDLCSRGERDAASLAKELGVSRRTVDSDIAWAKAQFAGQFKPRFDALHRRLFSFVGAPPIVLDRPVEWIADEEFIGVVAARGLLRVPTDGPAERGSSPYPGMLDGALHGFLRRVGLDSHAKRLAPEAIQVSRFAARAEDPAALARVVTATVRQEGLRFSYVNRWNEAHPVHGAPRRLVLIRGEFHCFMWTPKRAGDDRPRRGEIGRGAGAMRGATSGATHGATHNGAAPSADAPQSLGGGRLKQYRVARMADVEHVPDLPRGCPVECRQWRIDRELEEAFETTGGDRESRALVRLAVSPQAYPHLEGRTFGGEQRWTGTSPEAEPMAGLPPGWRRLEFHTTGLDACKYWVLGFGAGVRAEGPPQLVRWLREEVGEMGRALGRGATGSAIGRSIEEKRGGNARDAGNSVPSRRRAPASRGAEENGQLRRDAGRRESGRR